MEARGQTQAGELGHLEFLQLLCEDRITRRRDEKGVASM